MKCGKCGNENDLSIVKECRMCIANSNKSDAIVLSPIKKTCLKCRYEWAVKHGKVPKSCPKCHTKNWSAGSRCPTCNSVLPKRLSENI